MYDAVPEDTVLPAVVIGTGTTTDDGTKTLDARDYVFNIDVWECLFWHERNQKHNEASLCFIA